MAIRVIPRNPGYKGMLEMRANIPYATPDGEELALQMVKPKWPSGGSGFPVVVFVQGCGWTKPNQFAQIPQLCQLAAKGYVIASVTHRSRRTAPAPAFLQDVKCAIRFLRAHAAEYDIDKERVAVWGTSSGANAALMVGLTGDDPQFETEDWAGESSAVKVVVDCFGPPDVVRMNTDVYPDILSDNKAVFLTLGGGEDTWPEKLALVSPIRYVKPGLNLPPFLLLHGDADAMVFYEDTEEFYNALLTYGYEADLVRVTDAPHEGAFWGQELLDIIFDYLIEKL